MRVVERAYVMCNDKLLCYNNDGLPTTLKTKEVVRMNNNNSLSHTTWNCKYHIVFAPKYRRKVAYGKLREDIPINRYKYHGTFSLLDKNGMPLVAMHWEHRFRSMLGRYNEIYKVQMPKIPPHMCRHTYCSNMAKSGINPKTLQYLMGHSDISVTMNVYTHIGFDDAEEELKRMEEFRKEQAEVEQKKEKPMSQKRFKVV